MSGRKGCHLHVRRLNDDLLSELCQNHNPFFYLILIHDRWMSKDEEASMRASLQPDDFPVCDYPIRKPGKVTLFKTLLVWRRKITKLLNICFLSLDAWRLPSFILVPHKYNIFPDCFHLWFAGSWQVLHCSNPGCSETARSHLRPILTDLR